MVGRMNLIGTSWRGVARVVSLYISPVQYAGKQKQPSGCMISEICIASWEVRIGASMEPEIIDIPAVLDRTEKVKVNQGIKTCSYPCQPDRFEPAVTAASRLVLRWYND